MTRLLNLNSTSSQYNLLEGRGNLQAALLLLFTEHPASRTLSRPRFLFNCAITLPQFSYKYFNLRNGAWKLCLESMKHRSKSRILSWKVCGRYVVLKDLSGTGEDSPSFCAESSYSKGLRYRGPCLGRVYRALYTKSGGEHFIARKQISDGSTFTASLQLADQKLSWLERSKRKLEHLSIWASSQFQQRLILRF